MSRRKELKKRQKELDSEEAELIRETEQTELRVKEVDGHKHYYLKIKEQIGVSADVEPTKKPPKICPKCGRNNPHDGTYCTSCSSKL